LPSKVLQTLNLEGLFLQNSYKALGIFHLGHVYELYLSHLWEGEIP